MIIDLHTHTKCGSVCSDLTPGELVERAKQLGVDAVCLTEHNRTWNADTLKEVRRAYRFPVFGGVEVKTNHGYILVFGLREFNPDLWRAEKLRRIVDEIGGIMIAAHPIRAVFPKLSVSQLAERPLFQLIDEIETCNGASSKAENDLASQVCKCLQCQGVGGSDAHQVTEVGRCVTVFERVIETEEQLVAELKAKRFRPAQLCEGVFVPRG